MTPSCSSSCASIRFEPKTALACNQNRLNCRQRRPPAQVHSAHDIGRSLPLLAILVPSSYARLPPPRRCASADGFQESQGRGLHPEPHSTTTETSRKTSSRVYEQANQAYSTSLPGGGPAVRRRCSGHNTPRCLNAKVLAAHGGCRESPGRHLCNATP